MLPYPPLANVTHCNFRYSNSVRFENAHIIFEINLRFLELNLLFFGITAILPVRGNIILTTEALPGQ